MIIQYICITLVFFGLSTAAYIALRQYFMKLNVNRKLSRRRSARRLAGAKGTLPLGELTAPMRNYLTRVMPERAKNGIESNIRFLNTNLKVGDIMFMKLILALLLGSLGFILGGKIANSALRLLLTLTLLFLGARVPDTIIKNKTNQRRKKIRNALPSFIDYLTISIEAGLGLDISLYKIINQMRGPLAEEIAFAMTETKYGKSKREAFASLTERIKVPELTAFINALINGEQFGVSLGNILKSQGQLIREKKKQTVQEKAYKIAVKLVFPLVIFILPGIFIIILGPALIQVVEIFMK